MEIRLIHKKIAEAHFFLDKMIEHERLFFGDREHFDYYLSAFLNAGRTIDYRLCYEQKSTYPQWRKHWNQDHPAEDKLMKFMHDNRRNEVHQSGSSRSVAQEGVPLPMGTSHIGGVTIHNVSGPPDITSPAVAYKPTYKFNIGGAERKATEVCAEYLSSLQLMVADFVTDHAEPPSQTSL